jgi:ubiquinone/menaquinone biosynthesis C-methylase UbiE
MTAPGAEERAKRNRHEFSLTEARRSPYYDSGDLLRAKHKATDAAADQFPHWVLELIDDVPIGCALDAGCGWGRFSVPFLRNHSTAALTCSDLSLGMLNTARRTISDAGLQAAYVAADIEDLPFRTAAFDVVMANHVLYHMNSVPVAATELSRVLKADGRLVATTNSDLVRVPLLEIHSAVLSDLGIQTAHEEPSKFSLENGAESLSTTFAHVETHIFEHTVLYDVKTLLTVYLNTGRYCSVMANAEIDQERRSRVADGFRVRAERWLADEGEIASPQRLCAFICYGRRS